METVYLHLVQSIRDYFGLSGFKRAVLGLSGGIDSALVLKLAVDALKAENVTAIHMPELGVTDRINSEHAQALADFLNVNYFKININRILQSYENLDWGRSELAKMNLKARVRANILYDYANSNSALVIGTANKSEAMLGYGTKFGDLACDLVPLINLYKTEVYKMSVFLGLPQELIDKSPSAELFKGQTDELELGASYEVLDQILMCIEKDYPTNAFDPNLVKDVKLRIKKNRHKSSLPISFE